MTAEHPVKKLIVKETELARVQRIRVQEQKAHAETTARLLRQRKGIEPDGVPSGNEEE